jgi:hypothetical protein
MTDEPVSRMQPWSVATTQVTDSIPQEIVNDVSFGSEVRFLATTLPQFSGLLNWVTSRVNAVYVFRLQLGHTRRYKSGAPFGELSI